MNPCLKQSHDTSIRIYRQAHMLENIEILIRKRISSFLRRSMSFKLRSYSYKSNQVFLCYSYKSLMILKEDGVTVRYQLAIFALLQYETIFMPQTVPWHLWSTSGPEVLVSSNFVFHIKDFGSLLGTSPIKKTKSLSYIQYTTSSIT